jgi:hypothetical protein
MLSCSIYIRLLPPARLFAEDSSAEIHTPFILLSFQPVKQLSVRHTRRLLTHLLSPRYSTLAQKECQVQLLHAFSGRSGFRLFPETASGNVPFQLLFGLFLL